MLARMSSAVRMRPMGAPFDVIGSKACAELASRTPGEPAWCAALSTLRDAVAEQVSIEEWQLYPEAAKSLGGGEALHLGAVAENLAAATPSEDVIELDGSDILEAASVG